MFQRTGTHKRGGEGGGGDRKQGYQKISRLQRLIEETIKQTGKII